MGHNGRQWGLIWCSNCKHFTGGAVNEFGFWRFDCSGCGMFAIEMPLEQDLCPICGLAIPQASEFQAHLVAAHGDLGRLKARER